MEVETFLVAQPEHLERRDGEQLHFVVNYRSIFPASCDPSLYGIYAGNNTKLNNVEILFYARARFG